MGRSLLARWPGQAEPLTTEAANGTNPGRGQGPATARTGDTGGSTRSTVKQQAPKPPEERVLAPASSRHLADLPGGFAQHDAADAGSEADTAIYGPPAPGGAGRRTGRKPADDVSAADNGDAAVSGRPRLTAVKDPDGPPRRKFPLFGLRQAAAVVKAVYAALADPMSTDDEQAREVRAARLRRAGIVAGSTVLAVLMVYAIFPVREFLDHREAHSRQTERRDVLVEANETQEERRDWLLSDEGVEWLAREHGFTYPDEEPINVLPAPEP